ncbi:acyltransferase family protein [Acidicapsa ligni]|uniref:acyltransferase family protein n=1 Tax=Acidicapsa ligni TaxID=542300 RepID=UPI0021E0EF32|nr:acyltransferase [Acidicapsa ligni]
MFAWLSHFRLRRIITSNRFIPEVDGFRFLAIFMVIASHVFVQINPPIGTGLFPTLFHRAVEHGKIGVCLFFTISGFILALPFARHNLLDAKPVKLSSYFKRRLTRLEPPYVLAMLVRFPMVAFYKHAAVGAVAVHLLASLFYVHSLVYNQYSTINPPAWSLEIEVQFYILAPLLAAVFYVRPAILRRLILVVAILAADYGSHAWINPESRVALTLLAFSQFFLAGFLLCEIYLSQSHPKLPRVCWDLLGLVALGWILFGTNYQIYMLVLPFATILLYLAGFHGWAVRAFFAFPAVSIIGGMCYSLYLTHTLVLTGVAILLGHMHMARLPIWIGTPAIFALSFAATLAIGTIFFVLIERPCMDPEWPQKLARKFKGTGKADIVRT